MASSEKNPLNGHWTNNVVPLYSRCYDLIVKIDQIVNREKIIDDRQDEDINTLFGFVEYLEANKADKEQVVEAISLLASELYENFYTKGEVDELAFSTEIVDTLPEISGSTTCLYLVPFEDELGLRFYKKYVFKTPETPVFLGTTDAVSTEIFTYFMNAITDKLREFDQSISGITSGYVSTEQAEIILNEFHELIISEVESGLTEFYYTKYEVDDQVSSIREEVYRLIDGLKDTNENLEELNDFAHSIPGQVDYDILNERVKLLENKVEDFITRDITPTVIVRNITTDKDLLVTGTTNVSAKISAPTITIKNGSIVENARLSLTANEDIIVKNIDFVGDFGRREGGNTVMSVNTPGDISLKYIDFSAPLSGTTYNGIEIGLTSQPKSILIDSINFGERFENIPLIIYGVQDNAIINISNVHFGRVRNCVRFSNGTNAKNVTINFTNCSCDQWDINGEWSGFIKLQDYKSSAEDVVVNNVFSPEKVTINVHNFRYQGQLLEKPQDISEICGNAVYPRQFIYIWNDNEGFVEYNENRFPVLNIF